MARAKGEHYERNKTLRESVGKNNPSEYTDIAFNLGDTFKWTEEIALQVENDLKPFMGKIQSAAVAKIKANSVRSGALARSIKTKFVKKYDKETHRVWAGVGVDKNHVETYNGKRVRPIKYAHFIEQGFTHQPDGTKIEDKPFLAPAVRLVGGKEKAQSIVTNAIQKAIGKAL